MVLNHFLENFRIIYLQRLRASLEVFGNLRICLCHLRKSWHSQDKNLAPLTQKKLAGIQ